MKGYFEGDLVWVLSRRKYFYFSLYFNWVVIFRIFFLYVFLSFVNEFFFLRIFINDGEKKISGEKKNYVLYKCNYLLRGIM